MLNQYSGVFLTGGSGWLGGRLAEAITQGMSSIGPLGMGGHTLKCLVPAGEYTAELLAMGASLTVGSVNDGQALEQFFSQAAGGVLIHVAGLIHPPGSLGRVGLFDQVNFHGTRQLVEAAARSGIRRVVVMSSNSPFGGNDSPHALFTEESPYRPYMGYGRSKWKMELLLRGLMACPGMPEIVIARAPWFYGPRQPARQTQFFRMVREGKFPILGTGENRRSMAYVDSLVYGLLLSATHPAAANQIFWFADASPYSMREIVSTVQTVLRDDFSLPCKSRQLRLPSALADAARVVDSALQRVGLYQQKIHVLSEMNMTIACDISKSRQALGYEPLVSLREGMRTSVAWCLERGMEI